MPKRKAEVEQTLSHRRSSRNKTDVDELRSKVKSEEQARLPVKASEVKPPKSKTKVKAKEETGEQDVKAKVEAAHVNAESDDGPHYWLMKAEPETRIERGHDISFSIDDLAEKTSPEAWDGIRNYAARNNLRAMRKGDLAFFYHSSCKVPAIVGIMEIVKEHSPDLTAQDPKKPYYDPKDNDPENPRWSVVHVEFRRKFENPVTLSELKEMVKSGNSVLANMDLLGKGRLSVGKVSRNEWDFIMDLVEKKDEAGLEEKSDVY